MSRDRELTYDEVTAYERIHSYDHPLEVERGKIRRETSAYTRYRRKQATRFRRRARDVRRPEDVADGEEDPGEVVNSLCRSTDAEKELGWTC